MFGKKKPKLKCHVFERFATCGTGYTLNYDSGECEVRKTMILMILILFRTQTSVPLGLTIVEHLDLATSVGISRYFLMLCRNIQVFFNAV